MTIFGSSRLMRGGAVLAFTAALSASLTVLVPSTSARSAQSGCRDVLMIGVRGTGEDPNGPENGDLNMGGPVLSAYREFAFQMNNAGKTVQPLGLDYPAINLAWAILGNSVNAYNNSVESGVDQLEASISDWIA